MPATNPHNIPGLSGYVPPPSLTSAIQGSWQSNFRDLPASLNTPKSPYQKQQHDRGVETERPGAPWSTSRAGNGEVSERHLRIEKKRTGRVLLEVADDVASMGRKAAAEIEHMAQVYDANYESLKIEFERLKDKNLALEKQNVQLHADLHRSGSATNLPAISARTLQLRGQSLPLKAPSDTTACCDPSLPVVHRLQGDDVAQIEHLQVQLDGLSRQLHVAQQQARLAEAKVKAVEAANSQSKVTKDLKIAGNPSQSREELCAEGRYTPTAEISGLLAAKSHLLRVVQTIDAENHRLQIEVSRSQSQLSRTETRLQAAEFTLESLLQPFIDFEEGRPDAELNEQDKQQFYQLMLGLQRKILAFVGRDLRRS